MEIITDLNLLNERIDETNIAANKKDLKKVIKEIKDVLLAHKDIVGLTASQLGYKYRLFCINFNGDIRTFINPILTKVEGLHLTREKNPSIPDKEFIVPRYDSIIAAYQTPLGKAESNKFMGAASEVFESLLNILDGVTVADFGLEIDEDFDNATPSEQEEVLNLYIDTLKNLDANMQEEIESDKDLKQISDAIKFMNAVSKGEVTLEKAENSKAKNKALENKVTMRTFLRNKRK